MSLIKINKNCQEKLSLYVLSQTFQIYPVSIIEIKNDNITLISFVGKIIFDLPPTEFKIIKISGLPSIAVSGGVANNFVCNIVPTISYNTAGVKVINSRVQITGTVGLSTGSPIADLVMDDVNIIKGNGYIYDGEIKFIFPSEFVA